jgi:hypothetical protein
MDWLQLRIDILTRVRQGAQPQDVQGEETEAPPAPH